MDNIKWNDQPDYSTAPGLQVWITATGMWCGCRIGRVDLVYARSRDQIKEEVIKLLPAHDENDEPDPA